MVAPITHRITVTGISGCGKTQYINRVLGRAFDKKWPIDARTPISHEFVHVNNREVDITEFATGVPDIDGRYAREAFTDADVVIVLYDDRRLSVDRAHQLMAQALRYNPNVRFVIVNAKCQVRRRREVDFGMEGVRIYNEDSLHNAGIPQSFIAAL
jgi:GTPase SAR1 family protein